LVVVPYPQYTDWSPEEIGLQMSEVRTTRGFWGKSELGFEIIHHY
jgi:hypothetical protein